MIRIKKNKRSTLILFSITLIVVGMIGIVNGIHPNNFEQIKQEVSYKSVGGSDYSVFPEVDSSTMSNFIEFTPLSASSNNISINPQISIFDNYEYSDFNDQDGVIDAGETIKFRLRIDNDNDFLLTNVNVSLTSEDSYAILQLSSTFQSYFQIEPQSYTISPTYFIFDVNSSCPVEHMIEFQLEIETSETENVTQNFYLEVEEKMELIFDGYFVSAESDYDLTANNDGIINSGEEVNIDLYINNNGTGRFGGGSASIDFNESTPFINIDDASASYGDLKPEDDSIYGGFGFEISGAVSNLAEFGLEMQITDSFNTIHNITFSIVINGTPEYIINEIQIYETSYYHNNLLNPLDRGEKGSVAILIQNIGTAPSKSFTAYLSSEDDPDYLDFDRSAGSRYGTVSNLRIGQQFNLTSSYFTFFVETDIPEDYELEFDLNFEDPSGEQKDLSFSYQIPHLVSNLNVDVYFSKQYDEPSRESNYKLTAGERYYPNIYIKNLGNGTSTTFNVTVDASDKYLDFYYVNLESRILEQSALEPNEELELEEDYRLRFDLSEYTFPNRKIDIKITITDEFNNSIQIIQTITVKGGHLINWSVWAPIIVIVCMFGLPVIFSVVVQIRKKKLRSRRQKLRYSNRNRKTPQSSNLYLKTQLNRSNQNTNVEKIAFEYDVKLKFHSKDPSKLLENISKLHKVEAQLIKEKNIKDSLIFIDEEIFELKQAKVIFSQLEIFDLSEKLTKRISTMKDMRYQLKDTLFIDDYQVKLQLIDQYQETNQYQEINNLFNALIKDLKAHLNEARQVSDKEDIKKYSALLEDIKSKAEYNSFFVRYNSYLNNYNKMVECMLQKEYTKALELIKKDSRSLIQFTKKVTTKAIKNPGYNSLVEESKKLQEGYSTNKQTMVAQYSQILDGSEVQDLEISRITSEISFNQLNQLEKKDINSFIKSLDNQFEEWQLNESNENTKKI